MNFGKIGFWLHIWGFYVVTVVQKKNQNYYWWTSWWTQIKVILIQKGLLDNQNPGFCMGWPGLYLLLDNIDQLGSLCSGQNYANSFVRFLEDSRRCKIASEIFWHLQTIYNLQLVMNRWICFRSRHRFTIPWLIFKAVLRHWSPPDCWLDAQKLLRKTRVSMSPPLLLRISGFCHIFNAWKRVVIRNHLSKK